MSHHDGAANAEAVQQGSRVGRQLMQGELIGRRLARFAEANLIRGDHAPALLDQQSDRLLPRRGTEVLAVEQDDRSAIRLGTDDIHVGHAQALLLAVELEGFHRIGIVESFEHRAIRRCRRGGGGLRICDRGTQGEREQ